MKKKLVVKIVAVLVVLVILGLVGVYLSLGSLIKAGVETVGPMATQAEVTVGHVGLSPLGGHVELRDIRVGNPEGFQTDSLFKLGLMRVRLEPSSLMSDTIHIKEITIEGPEITYEAGLKGSNVGQLQKNIEEFAGVSEAKAEEPEAEAEPTEAAGPGKKVRIDRLRIAGGKVKLSIKGLGGKALSVPLQEIVMEDIGGEKDGKSFPEVLKDVMSRVTQAVTEAANSAGGVTADGVKDAGKALKEKTRGLLDSLKLKK